MKTYLKRILPRAVVSVCLILILLASSFHGIKFPFLLLKNGNGLQASISALHLSEIGEKLLVVAPHPDDESLGAGGLIHMAVKEGKQVKVVLVTNGDCFTRGVEAYQYQIKPRPYTYIQYGEDRQRETLNALNELGIKNNDVIFLGFPDKGIADLWQNGWSSVARHSICTLKDAVPYANSYQEGAPFTAYQLQKEMVDILEQYQPTSIIVTDSSDVNSDHYGSSNFLILSLLTAEQKMVNFEPKVFTYVIHSGYWQTMPIVRPLDKTVNPPKYFLVQGYKWYSLSLSQEAKNDKAKAISYYHTQETVMPQFLQNFERPNELFNLLSVPEATKLSATVNLNGFLIETVKESPVAYAPQGNSELRMINGGAYIEKLYAGSSEHSLFLCITTAGKPKEGTVFVVNMICFDAKGSVHSSNMKVRVTGAGPEILYAEDTHGTEALQLNNMLGVKISDINGISLLSVSVKAFYEGLSMSTLPWRFVEL